MDIQYGITEEKYILDDQTRFSYGIAIYAGLSEDGIMTILDEINDITDDKATVEALSMLYNDLQLSPIHLKDVIEDFLAQ